MKTLFFKICLSLVALVFSTSAGFSLPACPPTGYFHNCFGTYTFTSGGKYVGEWKDDEYHGQGTFIWPDGEKYVGEFRDDKRNGQGYYIFANGKADFCTYIGDIDSNCTGSNVYNVAPILL